jgi:hypothetical protein
MKCGMTWFFGGMDQQNGCLIKRKKATDLHGFKIFIRIREIGGVFLGPGQDPV